MLTLPCDHAIKNDHTLGAHITQTLARTPNAQSKILIFGHTPKNAATRYGYIETATLPDFLTIKSVKNFTEKPNKKTAYAYLKSRAYYWNTGIFTCSAKTLQAELNTYSPAILKTAKSCMPDKTTNTIITPNPNIFAQFPNISIDHALMEHTQNALLCDINHPWSDTGTWGALILSKCGLF